MSWCLTNLLVDALLIAARNVGRVVGRVAVLTWSPRITGPRCAFGGAATLLLVVILGQLSRSCHHAYDSAGQDNGNEGLVLPWAAIRGPARQWVVRVGDKWGVGSPHHFAPNCACYALNSCEQVT